MESQIFITKTSGEQELFNESKLQYSLERSGAPSNLAAKIVGRTKRDLRPGAKTTDIYRKAFNLLQKTNHPIAARYSLKKSLIDLGPTGFPFEKIIKEILELKGYRCETDKILQGKCVSHEIDVFAQKNSETIITECKFHNQLGIKTDVKVALYVKARFEDIKENWPQNNGLLPWLI